MKQIPEVVWCEFATKSNTLVNAFTFNPLDPAHPQYYGVQSDIKQGLTVVYEYRIKRKGELG